MAKNKYRIKENNILLNKSSICTILLLNTAHIFKMFITEKLRKRCTEILTHWPKFMYQ